MAVTGDVDGGRTADGAHAVDDAAPLHDLLALGGTLPAPDVRILEAALEQLVLTGVRKTSTDDIARRAGVNRATLYRRLGTKEDVVQAAFLYEASRVLDRIERAIEGIDDIEEYVITFFTVTLREVRENPLLAQLLEADRDEILDSLTRGAGDVLTLASGFLAGKITEVRTRTAQREGRQPRLDDVGPLSAVLARLTQSLLLTPDGPPEVGTDAERRRFARAFLVPLVHG